MMKEILYKSTRSTEGTLKASEAILKGLADDGGLFVPLEIPALDVTVEELSKMTYQQVAYEVMKLYFTDFTEEELKNCINNALIQNLIRKKLHLWQKLKEHISLNYSMARLLLSRIWLYQFYHIFLQHQLRRMV